MEPVMNEGISHVGLDVHKKSISICLLLPGSSSAEEWTCPNVPAKVGAMLRRIRKKAPGAIDVAYEAGPCGFGLQRRINATAGFSCMLVAPSLIPRKPGVRIKTDRRDARKLAELLRADLLTEVHPPTPSEEALRDLCRARAEARRDLTKARQRMGAFLLRKDRVYTETKNKWTLRFFAWLRRQMFENPYDQKVFDSYLLNLERIAERVAELEEVIDEAAVTEPELVEPVALLRCFHGIDTIAATTIATELFSFARFTSPRGLMAFLGLTPSEHSSGSSRRLGGITKTGNGHVRRQLIESAWSYMRPIRVSRALRERRKDQPGWAVAIAEQARKRLHKRYWKLVSAGKHKNKATTAVARELVGFIWAVLSRRTHQESEAA